MALHGRECILDHRAFLRLGHAMGVARIVDAVAEQLPASLEKSLDDLRVMLAQRDIERGAAAQTEAVHDIEQPLAHRL